MTVCFSHWVFAFVMQIYQIVHFVLFKVQYHSVGIVLWYDGYDIVWLFYCYNVSLVIYAKVLLTHIFNPEESTEIFWHENRYLTIRTTASLVTSAMTSSFPFSHGNALFVYCMVELVHTFMVRHDRWNVIRPDINLLALCFLERIIHRQGTQWWDLL